MHNNENLNDICLKVDAAFEVSIGDEFLLYYPMIKNLFNTDKLPKFNIIVDSFWTKSKIQDAVLITDSSNSTR